MKQEVEDQYFKDITNELSDPGFFDFYRAFPDDAVVEFSEFIALHQSDMQAFYFEFLKREGSSASFDDFSRCIERARNTLKTLGITV